MEDRYAPPSIDVVLSYFEKFGFPLIVDKTIIPEDDTTLFICSGMQRIRNKFLIPDGSKHGSLQSCIRTNDLELVGDGSHLTYFEMLGNFSFGGDYEQSVELWKSLLSDLKIKVDPIHCHPDNPNHHILWKKHGFETVNDESCQWSDGQIGGYCCEVYSRGIEIGNLVNTLGHSTDVGFGWERLFLIVEEKERIDQTSLFTNHHPIVNDHKRTLDILWENKVKPGIRGRNYVCRRLIRRIIPLLDGSENLVFKEWIELEKELKEKRLKEAKRIYRRHKDKSPDWWWETLGILPEEIIELK